MMTTSEILNEIYRLPPGEQKKIKQNLFEKTENETVENSSRNLWQKLYDEGVITHIPSGISDEDDGFEPVEIEGEPLSETIIRERR